MKKHVKTRQLNRDSQARKALFSGLIKSLVEHEEIKTTSAKAKAVQGQFEKLLTKARLNTVPARRQVQSVLQDPQLVKKLVNQLAPLFASTKGGYTKLTVVGNRRGDNAKMVKLSLTKSSHSQSSQATPQKPAKKSDSGKQKTTKKAAVKKAPPTTTPKPQKTAPKTTARSGKRGDR